MAEVISLSERMVKLETQLDNINTNLTELKTIVVQNNSDAEDKYASKQVENIVYWMVGIILLAFIGSLVTIAFKKKQ